MKPVVCAFALCASALTLLLSPFASATAAAQPKPSVSWSLAASANEGAEIPFTWSAKRLGPGHRLVIQRPFGTAKVWRTIMRLGANRGSAALAGVPLGRYRYRIAAFRGKRFLAAQPAGVSVYGSVTLGELLGIRVEKSVAMPTFTFPYVWSHYGGDTQSTLQTDSNNCTSVHLSFTAREYYLPKEPGTMTLTLVQQSKDPVVASTAFMASATLDAELVPGQTWAIQQSQAGPSSFGDDGAVVFLNGYGICDSREPIRK